MDDTWDLNVWNSFCFVSLSCWSCGLHHGIFDLCGIRFVWGMEELADVLTYLVSRATWWFKHPGSHLGSSSMQIWPNLFQSAGSVLYFGIGRVLSGEKGNSKETKMGKWSLPCKWSHIDQLLRWAILGEIRETSMWGYGVVGGEMGSRLAQLFYRGNWDKANPT